VGSHGVRSGAPEEQAEEHSPMIENHRRTASSCPHQAVPKRAWGGLAFAHHLDQVASYRSPPLPSRRHQESNALTIREIALTAPCLGRSKLCLASLVKVWLILLHSVIWSSLAALFTRILLNLRSRCATICFHICLWVCEAFASKQKAASAPSNQVMIIAFIITLGEII